MREANRYERSAESCVSAADLITLRERKKPRPRSDGCYKISHIHLTALKVFPREDLLSVDILQ